MWLTSWYISTLQVWHNLSPQGMNLKNNSRLTWKCLKQKFTFYHIQVNIQVRPMTRFLRVSLIHSFPIKWGSLHNATLQANLLIFYTHWVFAHNQIIKRLYAHHDVWMNVSFCLEIAMFTLTLHLYEMNYAAIRAPCWRVVQSGHGSELEIVTSRIS